MVVPWVQNPVRGARCSYRLSVSRDDACEPVTYRQRDVLALLALGLTAAESGRALDVSPSTVEHERASLRRSLGARTPPHLVAIAYESKLLPISGSRRERLANLIHQTGLLELVGDAGS
jgi:DNA-binding CsgD family transcriptional regulator